MSTRTEHIFTAHVEDRPGVLSRIAALFQRRNYNIVSLTVGRTTVKGLSRLTVVVDADPIQARLVEANLYKLVNVLRVEDVSSTLAVAHELILIKVRSRDEARVREICAAFDARIVDATPDAIIIENTGGQRENDDLVERLASFKVIEVVRTGVAAMRIGQAVLSEQPHFVNAQIPHDVESEAQQRTA